MAEVAMASYLNNATNTYFLGNNQVIINPYSEEIQTIPTANLDMWFDGATWSGTGNWLSSVNNATASLFGVTKSTSNGGILNFQSSSILEVTQSGVQPNYSTIGASGFSIVVVAQASGSIALNHGRLINDISSNWLFGTYGNGSQYGWYNNANFVVNGGGTQDFKWKIYAGVQHTSTSASMYVNNAYIGGNTSAGFGPNGIAINKGAYINAGNPASGEYTYTTVGQIMIYNRALTNTELNQIFNYFSGSYL